VEAAVKELWPHVDLVVVLAHQGKTGPMQSDAEGGPEVQRDVDEDLLIQVSGLTAVYDPGRPAGRRLLAVRVGGKPLDDGRTYSVATNSFLAEGGDLYSAFLGAKPLARGGLLADVVLDYLRREGSVGPPEGGRWVR
jgi:2',3'-cyclic-nucleotide 2'-phosphodiesterase (5'-nucleotidase family)